MRILGIVLLNIVLCFAGPLTLIAQESGDSSAEEFWKNLWQGSLSGEARFRFETFEREGAPFTGDSYAPTLRLALGYETPSFDGFSAFAQGSGVIVTGPADYSVPTLPSMNRPDRPAILDPRPPS